jgi:hypothetical protein
MMMAELKPGFQACDDEKVGRLFTGTIFAILITHRCEQRFYFERKKVIFKEEGIPKVCSVVYETIFHVISTRFW